MIKVQIDSTDLAVKAGTSQRTGRPYSIREQDGWGFFTDVNGKPHPHPQKVRITLGDEQQPYPVGDYMVAPASIYPDRYDQITIRARLVPLAEGIASLVAFVKAHQAPQSAQRAA